jgi:UDP-glucose 4-epimerase
VYVKDVVAANMLASSLSLGAGEGLDARAYNVGTGVGTSVNRLADILEGVANASQPRDHKAERPGELRHSTLDSGAIRSLGWAPTYSLEQGLRETYEHIASQRNAHAP